MARLEHPRVDEQVCCGMGEWEHRGGKHIYTFSELARLSSPTESCKYFSWRSPTEYWRAEGWIS
jgi:hypothetical protein